MRYCAGKVYLSIGPKTTNKGLRDAKNMSLPSLMVPTLETWAYISITSAGQPRRNGMDIKRVDVVIIGRPVRVVDLTRTIVLTGWIKATGYYKMLMGTELKSIFQNNVTEELPCATLAVTHRYKIDETGEEHI